MASNENRKQGNAFEREFCELLSKYGFWVHNMAQNQAGQPADVIAVRNGKAYLIDCKLCQPKGFPLSRIEPNQETAMSLWHNDCGNSVGLFALKWMDDIWMVSLRCMQIIREEGTNFLTPALIMKWGDKFEDWVKRIWR